MAPATNNDMWRSLRSRRNLLLVVVLVVVGYISFGQWRTSLDGAGALRTPVVGGAGIPKMVQEATPPPPWTFDVAVDRNNYSFTHAQCDTAFPLLYHEIDRARDYWRAQQGDKKISYEQIDLGWSGEGGMMVMIYQQQIYVTHSRGLNHFAHWRERSHTTLHQIQRAILASPEPVPDIEFAIKINDVIDLTPHDPTVTVWTYSRNIHDPVMDRAWVIPDFNFFSYPRVAGAFGDFQRQATAIHADFAAKRDQLVWRGTVYFNAPLRSALLAQTAGQPWSDVRQLDEGAEDPFRITMAAHCDYKFAVHTEGTTWSGRLKYLLSCHSTIISHRLSWYTHLYHLLAPDGPGQNYVQVENDWTDLPGKMAELIADPAKAERIADNAAAQFRDRYLSPAAETCYWRRLFQVWKEMAFEVDPWNRTVEGKGEGKLVKGMTYEEYL
ncbi:hypothetical protein LTR53_010328 [Teratosphaeriaceae sp. CCFEE 6253]|nr:hypothetical protein LTR53_010328 [Teratosphaeriaceae sp. CCFEE 6253]